MYIYIMRHGEAEPTSKNPDRPLTDYGRESVDKMANHFNNTCQLNSKVELLLPLVLHSDKLRAQETAQIMANRIHKHIVPEKSEILRPDSDPHYIIQRIEQENNDMLIVSHLPFVDHLITKILTDHKGIGAFCLPEAGVVCISYEPFLNRRLSWMLSPEWL